jgi:hypothetical protein
MLGFNNNKATVTLFHDADWAFDKVWIKGLIAELITAKIPPHVIHITHNYLRNWSFSALRRNSYSSLRPIQAGVPQGSLLGPTLFNIYVNDIPSVENISNIAISFCADDTNISVQSGTIDRAVRKLNSAIGLSERWYRKWRISVHNYTVFQTFAPLSPQYVSSKDL